MIKTCIVSIFTFLIINLMLSGVMNEIGNIPFELKNQMFTFISLLSLCGVVVICTCIIVGKVNDLKKMLIDFEQKSNQ